MLAKIELNNRLLNVCCVALYFYFLQLTYSKFVHSNYDYFGMGSYDPSHFILAWSWTAVIFATFFMPIKYERPSQFFLAIQFLVIFVPALIACFSSSLPIVKSEKIFIMASAMYAGIFLQLIFSYTSTIFVSRELPNSSNPAAGLWLCILASVVVFISAFCVLGGIFKFTILANLNAHRDLIDKFFLGPFLRYGLAWQSMVFLPVIFASGMVLRGPLRWISIIFCFVGYLLLFGLTATKAALFAPVILVGVFLVLTERKMPFFSFLSLSLVVVICVPYVLNWLNVDHQYKIQYINLVNFRTLAVPHLLYVQYLDFFSDHLLTYGSHVNALGAFVSYPYAEQVYKIIGEYYYPGSKMNANAGMWAQDGLAGFGILGILLISVFLSATMLVLDLAARRHDARWAGTCLAMVALFFCNASLFTTLLTGGLGLMILIFSLAKSIKWQQACSSLCERIRTIRINSLRRWRTTN
jgi:hypothetical protein